MYCRYSNSDGHTLVPLSPSLPSSPGDPVSPLSPYKEEGR